MSSSPQVAELEAQNAQLNTQLTSLTSDYANLKQQLEWFKRQLFGEKSEKRLDIDPAIQSSLFAGFGVEAPPPKTPDTETITYQRRKKTRDGAVNDSGLRFGEDVPRAVFELRDPEFDALPEHLREVIGEKFRAHSTQYWLDALRSVDVIVAPVQTYDDVIKDPQAWVNGYMTTLDHPVHGKVNVVGCPLQF